MTQKQVESSITRLNLSKITVDEDIQPRTQLNETVIEKYSEAMLIGAQFPPITVFYDGFQYWLADGFHRVRAKKLIGGRKILAEVRFGARRDAILYAVSANTTHGLSLCNIDEHEFFDKVLYNNDRKTLISPEEIKNRQRSRKHKTRTRKDLRSKVHINQQKTCNSPN